MPKSTVQDIYNLEFSEDKKNAHRLKGEHPRVVTINNDDNTLEVIRCNEE